MQTVLHDQITEYVAMKKEEQTENRTPQLSKLTRTEVTNSLKLSLYVTTADSLAFGVVKESRITTATSAEPSCVSMIAFLYNSGDNIPS